MKRESSLLDKHLRILLGHASAMNRAVAAAEPVVAYPVAITNMQAAQVEGSAGLRAQVTSCLSAAIGVCRAVHIVFVQQFSRPVGHNTWHLSIAMRHCLLLKRLLSLLVLTTLLLNGCRAMTPFAEPHSLIVTPSIVVNESDEEYPAKCSPSEVVNFVSRFFDAYNANDSTELVKFFEPSLRIAEIDGWFSDTLQDWVGGQPTPHFVTASRNEILKYIDKRHTQGERLNLRLIEVSAGGWHGGVDIQYRFTRQAKDLPLEEGRTDRVGIGKGTIKCPGKKIAVWSMTAVPRIEESTITMP